jgi:glycosyltransferase involved in cell wall biosynthesis
MLAYTFYECDYRVMRYAQTLRRRGHSVDVIAVRQPGQQSHEVIDGVNVMRIQERIINETKRSSYVLRLLLFFLRSMARITKQHFRKRYDFIHVHSVPDFLVFAALFPKLLGCKIILDIHDLLPEFYASKFHASSTPLAFRLLVAVERLSIAFSDHIIAANDIWQKTLVSRSVPEAKCTAILNFPDRSIFFRRERTRTDGKFIIIYPGTLNRHQGVDIAVRAFARIKDEVPEADFYIYGAGDLTPILAALIAELGLKDRVFLNDLVPLSRISAIMANADLGVVPKRNDGFGNEAFSTKILEFMAVGVPVIVAETKIDRYYFDSSLVKFFRSGDEDDLAKSMLTMIRDKQLRDHLREKAREFINKNNWEVKEHVYLNIVEALLPTAAVLQKGRGNPAEQ